VPSMSHRKINWPLKGCGQGHVTPFSILDSLLSVERMKADISNMVRRWIMAGTNERKIN